MKNISKIAFAFVLMFVFLSLALPTEAGAQTNGSGLGSETQKYIDNLNEVKEAQNDRKPVSNESFQIIPDIGFWKYVIYGALAGAIYAFWRWVKSLKS